MEWALSLEVFKWYSQSLQTKRNERQSQTYPMTGQFDEVNSAFGEEGSHLYFFKSGFEPLVRGNWLIGVKMFLFGRESSIMHTIDHLWVHFSSTGKSWEAERSSRGNVLTTTNTHYSEYSFKILPMEKSLNCSVIQSQLGDFLNCLVGTCTWCGVFVLVGIEVGWHSLRIGNDRT